MLGIGGGGILVPVLYELFGSLGVDDAIRMHLAVGTSLAVIIPTSLRSFAAHRARGAVDMEIIRSMALPVIAGVCLGAALARFSNDAVLKAIWVGGGDPDGAYGSISAGAAGSSATRSRATRSACCTAASSAWSRR